MEAATKNRRGRPKTDITIMAESALNEQETRTGQNIIYASKALQVLENPQKNAEGQYDSFFMTTKGNLRRQGILEQVGRMLSEGLSIEYGKELLEECKADYLVGKPVKEIEKSLRAMRMMLKSALPDGNEEGEQ